MTDTPPHRPLFPALPDVSAGNELTLVTWRVNRLEAAVQGHEDQLAAKPSGLPIPAEAMPWLKMIGFVMLLGLGATGHISPDTVKKFSGMLLP
jgi:hypothetical protein